MTLEQVIEGFAAFIGTRSDELMAEFRKRWPEELAPGRLNSLEFVAECLAFTTFPVDIVVAKEFGRHADAIREGLLHRLFEAMRYQFVVPEHRHLLAESEIERLFTSGFQAYADAWKDPKPFQTWGEAVAFVAWRRISGCKQNLATFDATLALDLATAFKAIAGAGQRFEVV